MSIYIKLDKPLEGEKILEQIQTLVSGVSSDSILLITTLVPQLSNADLIRNIQKQQMPKM